MVAPQLVVTSQPTTAVTAGVGFPLTVTAETYLGAVDTAFNGTVALTINTGPAGRRSRDHLRRRLRAASQPSPT